MSESNPKRKSLGCVYTSPRADDRLVAIRLDPPQGYLTVIPRRDAPVTFDCFVGPARKAFDPSNVTAERHRLVARKQGTHPVPDRVWQTPSGRQAEYIPGKHKKLTQLQLGSETATLVANRDIAAPDAVLELLRAANPEKPCCTDGLLPTYWAIVQADDRVAAHLEAYGFGPYTQKVQAALIQQGMAAVPYQLAAQWEVQVVSEFVSTTMDPVTLRPGYAVGWVPAAFTKPQKVDGWELSIGRVLGARTPWGFGRIRV